MKWVAESKLAHEDKTTEYPLVVFGFFGAVFPAAGCTHKARVIEACEQGDQMQLRVAVWNMI